MIATMKGGYSESGLNEFISNLLIGKGGLEELRDEFKVKKVDNVPPKRIKQDDVGSLFPQLGVKHDEQKRLAKIASSISGLANQLADKQRAQLVLEQRKSATIHS